VSEHIYRSHNKTLLLYHVVCPVRYRKKVFTRAVKQTLVEVSKEIELRYDIYFVEIGVDRDHVHFLIQSIPTESVKDIVQSVKSLTAREIFRRHKEVKKELWGGKFWTSGYYANTVGQYGNEEVIKRYVETQGMEYQMLNRENLTFFEIN
jgi:REP element-mobilizing transposase RayT